LVQGDEASSLLGLGRPESKAEFERSAKITKAALYAVQVFYSFFIMLLFMTYNVSMFQHGDDLNLTIERGTSCWLWLLVLSWDIWHSHLAMHPRARAWLVIKMIMEATKFSLFNTICFNQSPEYLQVDWLCPDSNIQDPIDHLLPERNVSTYGRMLVFWRPPAQSHRNIELTTT
jgi:hypothetical protein